MPGRIEVHSWSGAGLELGAITPMVWAKVRQKPARVVASECAERLRRKPAGLRTLFVFQAGRPGGLEDPISGGSKVDRILRGPAITGAHRAYYGELFSRIAAAGVGVDRLVLDYEGGVSLWQMGDAAERVRTMSRVLGDPRAAAVLPEEVRAVESASFGSPVKGRAGYLAFNRWAAAYRARALRELVVGPAEAAFGPQLTSSNYGDAWTGFDVLDRNGWPHPRALCGTDASPPLYLLESGNRYKRAKKDPRWNAFIDHMNMLRASVGALRGREEERSLTPWISAPGYRDFGKYGAPYFLWTAMIVHLLHAGLRTFILWNAERDREHAGVGQRAATQRMDEAFDALTGAFMFQEAADVSAEPIELDADAVTTGHLTTTYEDFLEHEDLDGRDGPRPAVWD